MFRERSPSYLVVEWPAVGEREWFQAISHGPWNCKSFPSGGMTPKNLHIFHLFNIEWLLVMRGALPPMKGPLMLGLPKVSHAVLKGTSGSAPRETLLNQTIHLTFIPRSGFCLSDPLSPDTSVTSRCDVMGLISLPAGSKDFGVHGPGFIFKWRLIKFLKCQIGTNRLKWVWLEPWVHCEWLPILKAARGNSTTRRLLAFTSEPKLVLLPEGTPSFSCLLLPSPGLCQCA